MWFFSDVGERRNVPPVCHRAPGIDWEASSVIGLLAAHLGPGQAIQIINLYGGKESSGQFLLNGTAHIYLWVAEVLLERSCLCYFLLPCTFREENFCHLAGECITKLFRQMNHCPGVEELSFSPAENTSVFPLNTYPWLLLQVGW